MTINDVPLVKSHRLEICPSDTGSLISTAPSFGTDHTTPPALTNVSNSHSPESPESATLPTEPSLETTLETTLETSLDPSGEPAKKKRKKRQTGVFSCDHPGCAKSFTRAEHLSRHKLNHNPTVIYKCPWENCEKSFVRSDLKDRHLKRHEMRRLKDEAKARAAAEAAAAAASNNKEGKGRRKQRAAKKTKALKAEPEATSLNQTHIPSASPAPTTKFLNRLNNSNSNMPSPSHLMSWLFAEQQQTQHAIQSVSSQSPGPGATPMMPTLSSEAGIPDPEVVISDHQHHHDHDSLLSAFASASNGNSNTNSFFNNEEADPFNDISSNLLTELIMTIPDNYFPNPIQQTSVTPEIIESILALIPSLASHEYLHDISHFLELFWNCFHLQYPMLHKPSFNTFTCPPILLLAMIMTGASYAMSIPGHNPKYNVVNPREFADLIATPLRFIIFSSSDFQSPAPVYIIQSLLILECYERLSTSRTLHERAYVHHGTAIQLLRRAPGLGGNPLQNKVDYATNIENSCMIWEKWIDFEMRKRTALFAFYIDAVHSSVFGYHFILNTQQIQLDLPCDDELWESYLNSEELPSKSDSIPFLIGLKKVLNYEHVKTSRFGKKILLSGLLTVMFQLQQDEIQGKYLEDQNSANDNWKDRLSLALDFWNCDILGNCCLTDNHINNSTSTLLPLTLSPSDWRCKYPVYHIAQITLRIQHYDYYIYAGAPWRMNVKAESADYEQVETKIMEWSNSQAGAVTVVYAYMFLFEMFLKPQDMKTEDDLDYSAYAGNNEAIYNRLNVVALVGLLVWGYSFSLYGAESSQYQDDELHIDEYEYVDSLQMKEQGIEYLTRIRDEMSALIGEDVQVSKSSINYVEYNNKIKKIATRLNKIRDLQHTVGLLKLLAFDIFKNCYWEVGREFSRLCLNCCKRSLGSKKVRCDDMYKTNYVTGL